MGTQSICSNGTQSFDDSEHCNGVLEKLIYQKEYKQFCDVILHVNGQKFYAHRCVLAACSPFLFSEFKVNKSGTEQLRIDFTNSELFECFLRYMYSGSIVVDQHNVIELLKLSHKLSVFKLKKYCAAYLEKNLDTCNILTVYNLSVRFHLHDLENSVCTNIANNISEILRGNEILNLSHSKLEEFIKCKKWKVAGIDLFFLLTRWIYHSVSSREVNLRHLLLWIPWNAVDVPEVREIVNNHPLYQESPSSMFFVYDTMHNYGILSKDDEHFYNELKSKYYKGFDSNIENEKVINLAISTAIERQDFSFCEKALKDPLNIGTCDISNVDVLFGSSGRLSETRKFIENQISYGKQPGDSPDAFSVVDCLQTPEHLKSFKSNYDFVDECRAEPVAFQCGSQRSLESAFRKDYYVSDQCKAVESDAAQKAGPQYSCSHRGEAPFRNIPTHCKSYYSHEYNNAEDVNDSEGDISQDNYPGRGSQPYRNFRYPNCMDTPVPSDMVFMPASFSSFSKQGGFSCTPTSGDCHQVLYSNENSCDTQLSNCAQDMTIKVKCHQDCLLSDNRRTEDLSGNSYSSSSYHPSEAKAVDQSQINQDHKVASDTTLHVSDILEESLVAVQSLMNSIENAGQEYRNADLAESGDTVILDVTKEKCLENHASLDINIKDKVVESRRKSVNSAEVHYKEAEETILTEEAGEINYSVRKHSRQKKNTKEKGIGKTKILVDVHAKDSVDFHECTLRKERTCKEVKGAKAPGRSVRQKSHNSKKVLELVCQMCNSVFPRKILYFRHMKIHFPGPPHVCDICSSSFQRIYYLLDHRITHSDEKQFKCKVCPFETHKHFNLKEHEQKHLEKNSHVCTTCGNGFSRATYLWKHQAKHSSERPFLCQICGKSTKTKDDLNLHNKIHTGKVHKCTFEGCKYTTPKMCHLKDHLLKHTKVRSYKCPVCSCSFLTKGHVRRHMKGHQPECHHQCQHCDYSTPRSDKLKSHVKKRHLETKEVKGTPKEKCDSISVSAEIEKPAFPVEKDVEYFGNFESSQFSGDPPTPFSDFTASASPLSQPYVDSGLPHTFGFFSDHRKQDIVEDDYDETTNFSLQTQYSRTTLSDTFSEFPSTPPYRTSSICL